METLVQDIASSREDRAKALREIGAEAKQVREEAQDLVKGFHTSRKQTGVQLRKDLAKETAHTKSEVKRVLGDAQALVKGFQVSRRKEGARMRKQLAEEGARRRAEVGELQEGARQTIADLQSRRKEMGSELNKELAQDRRNREVEVKEMRRDFDKMRAEVRADLNEAAAAWKGLAKTTPAKRTRVRVPQEIAEELPDLEAKLLAAINEHLNGITLTDVADSLGVVTIVLGRAARSLLDKGKVRKEDKLYFPVASE
jgi:uncharacterized protein YicC (UPF0701 family)